MYENYESKILNYRLIREDKLRAISGKCFLFDKPEFWTETISELEKIDFCQPIVN